jgi:ADP-dependent NAD(P)H-hydrate dehydratase
MDNLESPVIDVDANMLRAWPLPMPDGHGDKEARGRVLIVGGSREMPGAMLLAANAALRAGAGKVTVATAVSAALQLAMAVPETRVIGLPEHDDGALRTVGAQRLAPLLPRFDAVLIGPGMVGEAQTCELVRALLPALSTVPGLKVVLDAAAMGVIADVADNHKDGDAESASPWQGCDVLLTPHAGEMAHLSEHDKDTVASNPLAAARQMARRWQALVALKGPVTHVCDASGQAWRHEGGNVGLGVSGSGDTLAGLIVGLAARGASLPQATCWAVALHAAAGVKLATDQGLLGYLARDLAAQVPPLMHALSLRTPD